jgi:hypothetical protein
MMEENYYENKTGQELLQMLFAKLAELQDLNEVALLYDILGEDVPEEYWEQIEEVI